MKDEVIGVEPVGAEMYVNFQAGSSDASFKCGITLNNWNPAFVGFFNGNGSGVGFDYRHTIDMTGYSADWKHLVLVMEPGRFSAYVNGSKAYETNVSYSVFPAPLSALGRHWWPSGSSARMSVTYDNVRIYERALSDAEVSQLWVGEQAALPYLTIAVKTVQLSLYVEPGKTYQLLSSNDLLTWTPFGSAFVAVTTPTHLDVDVSDGGRYFKLQEL